MSIYIHIFAQTFTWKDIYIWYIYTYMCEYTYIHRIYVYSHTAMKIGVQWYRYVGANTDEGIHIKAGVQSTVIFNPQPVRALRDSDPCPQCLGTWTHAHSAWFSQPWAEHEGSQLQPSPPWCCSWGQFCTLGYTGITKSHHQGLCAS